MYYYYKQLSEAALLGVYREKCSEIVLQIYKGTPMPK